MYQPRYRRLRQILNSQLWGMRWQIGLASALMLVSITGELLGPWPLKIILDYVLLEDKLPDWLVTLQPLLDLGKVTAVVALSSLILLNAIIKGTATYLQTISLSRVGYELVYRLRSEMFHHLQQLSLSFHSHAKSGELITKVTGDTKNLRNLFASTTVDFPSYVAVLLGMSVVMLMLNWQLSLIVFSTFPILAYVLYRRLRELKTSAKKERINEGRMAHRVNEVLASMTLLQTFGREQHEERVFEIANRESLNESVKTSYAEAASGRTLEIINATGQCMVILVGALQAANGRMTPGDILIFSAYVNRMFKPVDSLVKLLGKLTRASVSVQRIGELLDVQPAIQDADDAIDAPPLRGAIEFKDVSFEYDNGKHVIQHASFRLEPGQCAALVGTSGAGKSTLAALLLRLFDPHEGSVCIDGIDIRRFHRESLRNQISVVLQDSFLSGMTVKDNIRYGNLDADDMQIMEAAKVAQAHDFIMRMPLGYDSVLGEKGITLSGGQRQRLALARAFIRGCPVMILDEPMTGLDVGSEYLVREALRTVMSGCTSLLITHDLDLAATADTILVLDQGMIVEQGSHAELFARDGVYRELRRLAERPRAGVSIRVSPS